MKRNIFLIAIMVLLVFRVNAQNDTMYIMKNGVVINKQSVKPADVDSIIFFEPDSIDADGNVYNIITIGTQVWMKENLKTTKYNDGTSIPLVTDTTEWSGLTTPAYCWYNNDPDQYKNTYGALYNWEAVNTAKLCPTGWHVPTDAEWSTLENFLIENGYNYNGSTSDNKIAKAMAGTAYWNSSLTEGTPGNNDYQSFRNKSGFTGLPGGSRANDGKYSLVGQYGLWWSASEDFTYYAWYRSVYYDLGDVLRAYDFKLNGYSVRCLRD